MASDDMARTAAMKVASLTCREGAAVRRSVQQALRRERAHVEFAALLEGHAATRPETHDAFDAVLEGRPVAVSEAAELPQQAAEGAHRFHRHETGRIARHDDRLVADAFGERLAIDVE